MTLGPSVAGGSSADRLPDPLPLVGRTQELAALEALLEDGGAGPGVVFIRGEGGVGKTRLAAELADRAERRNWTVAHGRAYPVEAGVPYAIFSDAWLSVLQSMDASTLTVLSRGGEAELRYLFPALGERSEDLRDAAVSEPEEFRTRLMWNFAEFVKRYASRAPVLCILEDVQWADESSLDLIHFLARHISDQPILLVCTYNDQERDSTPHLVQTERSLVSIGAGDVLPLGALTRDQIAELVSRTFSVDASVVREFSAMLFGWTRGNAFFAKEIIQTLVSSGRLHLDSETWVGWDAREFDMPASIRDAIMARARAFPDDTRMVLEMAAVVGNRASYSLLETISGLDSGDVLGAVETLCHHGLLEEQSEGSEVVYEFRHPLVQQTLYREFGLQRVRVLHGAVAEAMEQYYGAAAEEHADELAFHFARTDGKRLRSKASRYLAAAGRSALERRASSEAVNYLEAALDRAGDGEDQDALRASVVPLLARAHSHEGHFDKAAQLWASALEGTSPDEPGYAEICRALGMVNIWRGHHEEAAEYLDAGLAVATERSDTSTTVSLLVAMAHGLHELGRGDDALRVLARALPAAESLGDEALLAKVHRALALLHVWIGPPEKAVEHGERAIELAERVGDLSTGFWARWGLAVLAGMRGDTRALSTAIAELNEIADRVRSPGLRLWTAEISVELAYGQGEWDTGIAMGEQSIALARSLNQRTLLTRLLVWTTQFHVARGDIERAESLVQEAVELSGINDENAPIDVHQVVPTYIGLALYLVHLGDYEEAIEAAEKGLKIAEGTGYILWALHQLLPILAEACLWAGHVDRAAEVSARMRAHAERIDHRIGRAWADGCDSLVRSERGDPEGAVEGMLEAADALEAIPMIWTATRLRRQLARRLYEIGRRDQALEQLGRVHAICASVRAGLELEKTRAMYREMGLRPPPIGVRDSPLGLTAAESKVAIRVAQGMTNKAIAVDLRCAVRTVSTHLSNIYQKSDIGGAGARVRLGNLVREAGLLD